MRQGIIPEHLLTPLEHPWKLSAANGQRLSGGDKEAHLILKLDGFDVDTKNPHTLKIPTNFLVADLGKLDAIVSYDWLAQNDLLVNGKRHGICHCGAKK